MNIYVGSVPYDLTEKELENLFSEFGTVESAKIIEDRDTGRSKGFGFVEMPNSDEAEKAIAGLDEKEIKGRELKVNQARPRENRSRF
jgi:RNA recognition motif-containing protein